VSTDLSKREKRREEYDKEEKQTFELEAEYRK